MRRDSDKQIRICGGDGMAQLKDLIRPASPERCGDRSFPVLSMTMHDGIVLQSDRFKKSLASVDQSAYKVVRRNQLVVGFPIDEGVLYIQQVADAGIMSPAYDVWNVDETKVDLRYFELCLHSPQSMMFYKTNLRGTTARRRSLPKETLLSLPLPVPSMEKQREIATTVGRLKEFIELRQRQLRTFDTLIKARFVEMFGDYHTNSKGFETHKGSELFRFSSGKFLPEEKRLESGIPVYGGNGIAWYTDTPLIDYPTIIIGRVGAQCGNIHTVTMPVWITDNAIYIKEMKTEKFTLEFLSEMMRIMDFYQYADFSG